MGLLEITFFVNSAGLFLLSALIEKNQNAQKKYEEGKKKKEITSAKMPPALVEGFESLVLFCLMILLPGYINFIFSVFAIGVTITILQRLNWASKYL
mmetsp:Transcript_15754/g.26583  ORF Transcript_15754/g.26583 Transcript_15754/m.26583 type:complete len:97 (+) Transcript_15754:419-709(+)